MTTICSFESNHALLKAIIGESKTFAPIDGVWSEVSAQEFEEQVRHLAYGLMVKNFRRDETVVFIGCSEFMLPFISTACKLAHLNAQFEQSDSDTQNIRIDASLIDYLISIGRTWAYKYKSSVDRTLARIILS